jgi:hypothetical protein
MECAGAKSLILQQNNEKKRAILSNDALYLAEQAEYTQQAFMRVFGVYI